ncbi:Dyp-type peroxidase [Biformimicrobium ophioploci]|uniref:Dyp-type peroxidase n=1 Tax=Biformimicrobium ophioploci TaxID=3036711 RepID=A0ABQ6M186_9GAMM|nr:Dyp-type peroxidase [Microbulbifer sp. NKW57]GMG88119.1 Dyp-type peroxidase [Microbulbifer sp. NKW57]
MSTPQAAIFNVNPPIAHAFEGVLRDAGSAHEVAAIAAGLHEQFPERVLVAFGKSMSAALGMQPPLEDFHPVIGSATAPASQGDLMLWIQGNGVDEVFDSALAVRDRLDKFVKFNLEQRCFRYRDNRDLTGFIDGTENPVGEEALQAAVISEGPAAGGSVVLSQRWLHNLHAFHAMRVSEQEEVIGRTKPDSIQLRGDAMPVDSHVSRTDVEVDGQAMAIFRKSMPFGDSARHGLYFLAFACEQRRFEVILRRMFGLSGDGIHDRLTEFSHPESGAYWYAPPAEQLRSLLP